MTGILAEAEAAFRAADLEKLHEISFYPGCDYLPVKEYSRINQLLGDLYRRKKNFRGAKVVYLTSHQPPESINVAALYGLAECCVASRNVEEFKIVLAEYLSYNRMDLNLISRLMIAAARLGLPEEVDQLVDAMRDLEPDDAIFWQRRAEAEVLLGRLDRVEALNERAKQLAPDHSDLPAEPPTLNYNVNQQEEKRDEVTVSAPDVDFIETYANIEEILRSKTENISIFGYNLVALKGERLAHQLKTEGIHEWAETALVPHFIRVGSTVLDVGANIGYYTFWFHRLATERGTVHAFEVNPLTFEMLKKSIDINGTVNVIANHCAVGAECGTLDIPLNYKILEENMSPKEFNLGGYSLRKISSGNFSVRMITIDDYVETNNLENVHFLKVDVEGFEKYVLKGAAHTLRTRKPAIMIEFAAKTKSDHLDTMEAVETLSSFDYCLYGVAKRPHPHLVSFDFNSIATAPYIQYAFCVHKSRDFLGRA